MSLRTRDQRGVESISPTCRPDELTRSGVNGNLPATTDFAPRRVDVIDICVPTPLRKTKDPDMSYVIKAAEAVAATVRPGQLIILESTTYPGTTDEVLQPALEACGLKPEQDFFLAFSPERVDPGNGRFVTKNIPKVVGGIGPEQRRGGLDAVRTVVTSVVPSARRGRRVVKLLENTFRAVNIALVNELR